MNIADMAVGSDRHQREMYRQEFSGMYGLMFPFEKRQVMLAEIGKKIEREVKPNPKTMNYLARSAVIAAYWERVAQATDVYAQMRTDGSLPAEAFEEAIAQIALLRHSFSQGQIPVDFRRSIDSILNPSRITTI